MKKLALLLLVLLSVSCYSQNGEWYADDVIDYKYAMFVDSITVSKLNFTASTYDTANVILQVTDTCNFKEEVTAILGTAIFRNDFLFEIITPKLDCYIIWSWSRIYKDPYE